MSTGEPASYNISISTSHVAADLAGLVRLLQVLHLLLREGNIEAACGTGTSQQPIYKRQLSTEAGRLTEDVLEVRQAGRADDGSAHTRLGEHPRKRDLRHADALLLRELINPGDDAISNAPSSRSSAHRLRGTHISTYLDVSWSKKGMSYVVENLSVLPRTVASRDVRVSRPRASGDHGIAPTPNICEENPRQSMHR